MKPEKQLVYLACPYSHPDPSVMETRFLMVNHVAAKLMAKGMFIYSPISHTHPIAKAGKLPKDWKFWEKYDRAILACCKKLIVLMLPNWEHSIGVEAETKIAKEMGIPIDYMQP